MLRMSTGPARRASVLLAAAGVFALTACGVDNAAGDGGSEGSTELSTEDVTLRVTWWGGDARHERTQEAIDVFEEDHPNISIEPEFSDWTGYWDRLATATAGGNAPDVIQMDLLYLASYADRGILTDLSTLPQLDTSALPDPVLDMGRSGGTLAAMPISTTAFGVLVNTDVLDELGLSLPDTSSWTWDEFNEFAASVSAASGGEVYGIAPWFNGYSLELAARQLGDSLFEDGQVAIDPETLAGYYQRSLDWITGDAGPTASQYAEQSSVALDQMDFSTGRAAMLYSQVTQLTAYSEAAGGANMVIAPLPADDDAAEGWEYFKPGMYWSVAASSEHPAEAALFVDFMVNDPDAAAILGTERGMPANPEMVAAISDDLSEDERAVVEFSESREPELGDAPAVVPNGASELESLIQRYQQEVLFEQMTPEEAAEALIAELQAAIDAAA